MHRTITRGALWSAASLAHRSGYRVRVIVPRAAGVVNEARGAAGLLNLDARVAISATHIVVHLEDASGRRAAT